MAFDSYVLFDPLFDYLKYRLEGNLVERRHRMSNKAPLLKIDDNRNKYSKIHIKLRFIVVQENYFIRGLFLIFIPIFKKYNV